MSYLSKHFKDYDCDEFGNVYKHGKLLSQCNSNGYKQVTMRDENFKRRILGVHVVVAMKYLDYFEGCIVHHKDRNKSNNNLDNLEIRSEYDHKREHALENEIFRYYNKGHTAWNKGIKMSDEFRKHCSENAKKRGFVGNQFVDAQGNRR